MKKQVKTNFFIHCINLCIGNHDPFLLLVCLNVQQAITCVDFRHVWYITFHVAILFLRKKRSRKIKFVQDSQTASQSSRLGLRRWRSAGYCLRYSSRKAVFSFMNQGYTSISEGIMGGLNRRVVSLCIPHKKQVEDDTIPYSRRICIVGRQLEKLRKYRVRALGYVRQV